MIHPAEIAKGAFIVGGYVAAIYLALCVAAILGLWIWGLMRRIRPISDEPGRLIGPPHRIYGR